MGYTTEFEGRFELDKPLLEKHAAYLNKFSSTRRMKRNAKLCDDMEDPIRKAVNLPVGYEGEFFVNGGGDDESIVDRNSPPHTQPGLWCKWIPTEDLNGIEWNGVEKFYYYTRWLQYIISSFLEPWGYVLNGTVRWRGEDFDDVGMIEVKDNVITERSMLW